MSNLLKTGLSYLASTLKSNASETVTYVRGASRATIQATFGKTPYKFESESGFQVGGEIIDFIFSAADLVIGGIVVTPDVGDKIITDRATYKAQMVGNEGCWKYSDPFAKMIRFHTQEVYH